ncbi:hypothetical protein E4U52_003400 [Claviceps spartinae]|nr:hypothetical protein E4U52_003400 [Claviceps spartinae]
MADFLASFNFGAQNDLRRDDGTCLSVAELERRLRNTIQEKKTEVRAERINNVFNIAGTAEFTINATQTQTPNNGPVAIDPMLRGAEPMDVDMDNQAQSVIYTALSILRSQPSSNPSIQQAVATQIVAAASAADSSSWILHHTELTTMGWTFTYLCESSTTIWNMRNQHKVKVIVGDFSKRDPNPLLMSRPAFDCKGRLIISFPRKERQITVRYDHMPLHMTVADHMEFTKPPPMIGPQKPSKATLIEANRQAQKEAASAKRRANRLAKKQEAMEAQEAAIRDGIASPEKPRKEIQRKDAEAAELSLVDQVRPALDDADVMQLQQAISYEEEQVENATAPEVTPTEHPGSKALIPNVTPEEEQVEYGTASAVAPTEDPGSKALIPDVTHEEEQVEYATAPAVTPTEDPGSKALIPNVTPEEEQVEYGTASAVTPTEDPGSKALIPDVTYEEEQVEYATAPAVTPNVTPEEEQVEYGIAPAVTPTEDPVSKALIPDVTYEEAQVEYATAPAVTPNVTPEEEQVEYGIAPAVTPTEDPVSKALTPSMTPEEEQVEYAAAPAVTPTEDPGSKALIPNVTHEEEQVENAIAPVVTPTEPPPSKALILNVTPEEAERRMDVALRMLAEAGIDSATLTADQLTIFANQAPDLQKESLNMLITYGAERLQIIHPNDREALPSAPPPAAAPSVGDANEQNRTATTTQDSCPKDRPVCMVCQAAGYVCEYPPHPSSKRTCKSTAIVDESADVDMVADTRVEKEQVDYKQAPYHAAGAAQTHVENENNEDEHGDDNDHGPLQQDFLQEEQAEQPDVDHYPTEQYSSFPSAPVNDFFSDMPNESVNGVYEQPPSLPYFQSASELKLPQPDAVEEMPQSQLSPDLALQQSAAYFPTYNARSPTPASPQHAPPVTDIPPEHGEAPYSHHVRQNSNAAATSSSWSQGANTNDANATAKTSAPRIPSPIPHDFPEAQSLDQVVAALHMAQLEDAYLLAHAATSGQRYTSGPSVKMKQPVNHTPETAPVSQPPHDPWSTPQEGYRNADSASQRASRASEYPPDPISSSRNSNSNNDTHDHNHSHDQNHNHIYNINSSNHNHNSERNNTKNKIASSSSRISSSERRSRRGPTWSRLSGGASPPTNEPDKIGYKPYSFRKGTSSDSDSDQPSDLHETGGSTAETKTGVYESVTTQSNSWAEDCEQDAVDDTRPGSSHQGHQNHQHQSHSGHQRNENHQTHQSHQTHQARQTRQNPPRHQQQSQQRQGFEWGLHDSWTRGH